MRVFIVAMIFLVNGWAGCGYKTAPTPMYDVPQEDPVEGERRRRGF